MLQITKPFGIHFDIGFCRPIPSNANLKKERPVCIFFTLEGHGDHTVKRVMQRGRGWVRTGRFFTIIGTIAARLELRGKGEKKSYKRREKRLQK